MIKSRNQTSHTYNEGTAQEISTAILTAYHQEFVTLKKKLEEYIVSCALLRLEKKK